MNKQLAKKGTKLNKNMTNTASLQLNDLTVTNNLIIPIDVEPEEPANPKEGTIYLKYQAAYDTFETMLYLNGHWI